MKENTKEFLLTDNQKFMAEQIENTVAIIEEFSGNRELSYTALQNALLLLVVLPFESAKRKNGEKIWKGAYKNFQKRIGFEEKEFYPISSCKDKNLKKTNKTQYSFIRKFRNAVAHQNIEIKVHEDRKVEIVFFNVIDLPCYKCDKTECKVKTLKRYKEKVVDFRVSFTYPQLHNFALCIADTYLKSITGKGIENKNGEV